MVLTVRLGHLFFFVRLSLVILANMVLETDYYQGPWLWNKNYFSERNCLIFTGLFDVRKGGFLFGMYT